MNGRNAVQAHYTLPAGAPALVAAGDYVVSSGLVSDRPGGLESESHRIFQIAIDLMRQAGVTLDDVVRTRAWYVDEGSEQTLRDVHGVVFNHPGPALSAIRVSSLPGGVALAVEVEAVAGAADRIERFSPDPDSAASAATKVDGELRVAGITGDPSKDGAAQVADVMGAAGRVLREAGLTPADVVATRHFMRHDAQDDPRPPEWADFMSRAIPTSAGIAVEGFGSPEQTFMLELEAVEGASGGRNNLRSGRSFEVENNYCRSVRVDGGSVAYVAGTTAIQRGPGEVLQGPRDVAAQVGHTLETIRWAIEEQGLEWSDLVSTRTYVVGGQEALQEAASALQAGLEGTEAAVTLLGVPVLGREGVVVEIEARAVAPG